MAQWVRLMLGEGAYNGRRLVSEKSFSELIAPHMHIAPKFDYGYGWMLREWNGHKVVEHGGNITGYNAQVALMPDQKLGFVLLTNVSASSLGSFTMSTVWENLVDGASKAAVAATAGGPPTDPSKEVGTYKIAGAPVSFDVSMKDSGLTFTVAGQPPYPLVPLGGRRYKLGSPAPDGFFATFRPVKEKPDLTEILVEQPQGNVVALREVSSYQAPISVDELMKKIADARGGEANLRKHRSAAVSYDVVFETQGVTGRETEFWDMKGAHADDLTLIALGKKIATIRECFDGKQGSTEVSFAQSGMKQGKSLYNAPSEAAFAPELDWKKLYKSVAITKVDKVDGEECYVVEKTVDKGDRFTDYVSTKNFLVLKNEGPGGGSVTFKDFRDVGGIKMPFQMIRNSAGGLGTGKMTVKDVRLDARIDDSTFRPKLPVRTTSDRTLEKWTEVTGYE
jgi:hypothetical protein